MPGGLEKRVAHGLLLSFYGKLLTARQQQMLQLYCDEDCSIGEIARQLSVTRQCVCDTIQRAFARLDDLEDKLGLVMRFDRMRAAVRDCKQQLALVSPSRDTACHLNRAKQILDQFLSEEEE
ncbi:MAG: sigma factor-like helix-turn-helix DNA-binding protein [Christensenellales bacterium]|jgi:predicted DNA-binding protein YlxM (UPF0122 family)